MVETLPQLLQCVLVPFKGLDPGLEGLHSASQFRLFLGSLREAVLELNGLLYPLAQALLPRSEIAAVLFFLALVETSADVLASPGDLVRAVAAVLIESYHKRHRAPNSKG